MASSPAAAAAAALSKIERAHQMYRQEQHEEALALYTDALAVARSKPQKIALHSNRAACFLKLHDFQKATGECTAVLELDREHTGALMLRAQTLVTLKDYQSALFDVNRLMELNPDSDVYQKLQAGLRTQLSLAPIPESEEEEAEEAEHTAFEKRERKSEVHLNGTEDVPVTHIPDPPTNVHPKVKGWEAIPKPKGHSGLDYSRWDRVEDDSSEEDEDDEPEEQQPQYRFRVRTVGVRPVK